MIQFVVEVIGQLLRGDPLKRAYRRAWIQDPDARGDRRHLEVMLELENVRGRDDDPLPQPLAGAMDDWSRQVPPKQMRHRSGGRLRAAL
ncbi:hypothetical protein [Aeromicrobium alkaliterrae]|uniref:Uncharacterized protein n=1 Tax=Aeromicrobium alkaliterrae TaxID=302168 RepID=A0ABP4VVT8_9ACTN